MVDAGYVPVRTYLLSGLALFALLSARPAEAVIVDFVNGAGTTPVDTSPVNTTAPVDPEGDPGPGWYRTSSNISSIYLGNQWVLSAAHVGVRDIVLPGGTFEVVPNSDIILTNTSGFGLSSGSESDLRMWRIKPESTSGLKPEDADPNLAADAFGDGLVRIAQSKPTLGTEVRMIGAGRDRIINANDPNGHTLDTSQNGTFPGIRVDVPPQGSPPSVVATYNVKTWGTNRIDNANLIPGINSGFNVTQFGLIAQGGRGVVSQLVQFDSDLYSYTDTHNPSSDTPTEFEAQGAADDSGGPVFFKQNGEWVLAGVMHAISTTVSPAPPGRLAAFGNVTILSDLSQSNYRNQIEALLNNDFSGVSTNLTGYSINGDLNLDGVVSGDGAGNPEDDDVAAFVAGWRHTQDEADVYSWQKGDLNLDGTTDLEDFQLLRDAFNGTVSAAQFQSLLAVSPTPEPTAAALFVAALACTPARRRR